MHFHMHHLYMYMHFLVSTRRALPCMKDHLSGRRILSLKTGPFGGRFNSNGMLDLLQRLCFFPLSQVGFHDSAGFTVLRQLHVCDGAKICFHSFVAEGIRGKVGWDCGDKLRCEVPELHH